MFNGKGFFEKLLGNPLIYIPLLILIAVITYAVICKK